MAIKAVMFDMGNTLVDSRTTSETMSMLLQEKGHDVSVDDVRTAIRRSLDEKTTKNDPEQFDSTSAEDFYTGWNNEIIRMLDIDNPDASLGHYIFEKWFEKLHIYFLPGAEETLKRLRSRNIKIGIITNGFRDEVDEVFAGLPIKPDDFDVVVGCNTTGFAKPDPRPFRFALEKLGLLPEETIFVGDSYKNDYLGSQGVGMLALLYLRKGDPPAPDIRYIRSLEEVLNFL